MFILDDILLAPAKGFMWLVRELHSAAEQEFADERERVMRSLQSLHMRLEAGQLSPDAFEAEEARLLDRLDELDGVLSEEDEAEEDEADGEEDGIDESGEVELEADEAVAADGPSSRDKSAEGNRR
ncbi:MAG: gas vesicle protein GvpG [Planctomycetota bacterium]